MSSLNLVLKQLQLNNDRKIAECSEYFAEDLKVYLLPTHDVFLDSKKTAFDRVFKSIEDGSFLPTEVLSSIENGPFATLHICKGDRITARKALMTYFVEDRLIRKVWIAPD